MLEDIECIALEINLRVREWLLVYIRGNSQIEISVLNVDPMFEVRGNTVATSRFHVWNHKVLIRLQNYNFFCLFNFCKQFNSYSNLNLFKHFN